MALSRKQKQERHEKALALLDAIGKKGFSLTKAAKSVKMRYATAWDIVNSDDYADGYARAREERAWHLAEETLAIADDETIPADHKRVMVDTRKWFASKLNVKLSDRVQHDVKTDISLQVTKIEHVLIAPEKPEPLVLVADNAKALDDYAKPMGGEIADNANGVADNANDRAEMAETLEPDQVEVIPPAAKGHKGAA